MATHEARMNGGEGNLHAGARPVNTRFPFPHLPQLPHGIDSFVRLNWGCLGPNPPGASMIRIRVPALAAMAVALLIASCSGSNKVPTRPAAAAPDPQWVSSISQHSSGAISRHSPVRVFFTNDVVPQERVGTDASANITITPSVKVHATFGSRREIVLRPDSGFAPGTDYRVSVHAAGLTGSRRRPRLSNSS